MWAEPLVVVGGALTDSRPAGTFGFRLPRLRDEGGAVPHSQQHREEKHAEVRRQADARQAGILEAPPPLPCLIGAFLA